VTVALFVQLGMSLRDVNDAVRRMEQIGRQLAHEDVYNDPRAATPKSSVGARVVNCLERAESMILDQQAALREQGGKPINSAPVHPTSAQQHDAEDRVTENPDKLAAHEGSKFESRGIIKPFAGGKHPTS
jgi:hypothetical protein